MEHVSSTRHASRCLLSLGLAQNAGVCIQVSSVSHIHSVSYYHMDDMLTNREHGIGMLRGFLKMFYFHPSNMYMLSYTVAYELLLIDM